MQQLGSKYFARRFLSTPDPGDRVKRSNFNFFIACHKQFKNHLILIKCLAPGPVNQHQCRTTQVSLFLIILKLICPLHDPGKMINGSLYNS